MKKRTGIITNTLPNFIFLYSLLPLLSTEFNITLNIIVVVIFPCWIYYIYYYSNYRVNWMIMILSFLFLLLVYFYTLYDTIMVFWLLLIIFAPFLLSFIKKNSKHKDIDNLLSWFVYAFSPLSFLFISMVIIKLVEKYIDFLFFTEQQFIIVFVFIFIAMSALYTLSLLNKIYNTLINDRFTFLTMRKPLVFSFIISALVIPDILIAFSSYDLYLNLFDRSYTYFDRYYYSFSMHFLTPISEQGLEMQELLLETRLGQCIYIFHMLTIRIIDVTVLASIHNLFKKTIKFIDEPKKH